MRCIVNRDGKSYDAKAELVMLRRRLYNDLNLRLELNRTIPNGGSEYDFANVQAFYNAMTFAILAFEEAYRSTTFRIK